MPAMGPIMAGGVFKEIKIMFHNFKRSNTSSISLIACIGNKGFCKECRDSVIRMWF